MEAFLLTATLANVAAVGLGGAVCGWVLGYAHRGLVEWGRAYGRLARDIRRAVLTGRWTA